MAGRTAPPLHPAGPGRDAWHPARLRPDDAPPTPLPTWMFCTPALRALAGLCIQQGERPLGAGEEEEDDAAAEGDDCGDAFDDDDDDDDDDGGDFEAIGRDGESSTSATAALRRQYLGSPLVAPSINAQVTLLRDFVTAPAARMAAVAVFGLANRLGSAMRAGWQPLLRIVFRMRDLHLLDPGK